MINIILLIFLIGVIFITMGYIEIIYNLKKKDNKIEYRFIPRNIYDQIESRDLQEQMNFMDDVLDIRGNTNLI